MPDINAQLQQYAPLVYLYPYNTFFLNSEEDCYPAPVDWYIGRTQLCSPWVEDATKVVVDPHPISERLAIYGPQQSDILYLDDKGDGVTRNGIFPTNDQLWPPPCYAHAAPVLGDNGPPTTRIQFQYYLFYPLNGALAAFGYGEHVGDWEYVIVEIDELLSGPATITRVYLSCHADDDSNWHATSELQFESGTHPIVYAAYHSHALYASPGMKTRLPSDDHAAGPSDGGVPWETWTNCIRVEASAPPTINNQDWILYTGRFGQTFHNSFGDSPTGPCTKANFNAVPDGALLKEVGNTPIYVIVGGAQFHVPASEFQNMNYDWSKVIQVSDGFMGAFPVCPRDGTLVRERTGQVTYVCYGGAKFALGSGDWSNLGLSQANTVLVPDTTLAGVPTLPRNGTVLQEFGLDPVYVIDGGQKRWIRSMATLNGQYGGIALRRVVPGGALSGIPAGDDIS